MRLHMPTLIPKEFRRREVVLTASAICIGLLVGAASCFTRFGAYGGWVLLTIVGMFTFLALGRQERAFFVAIFGTTLFLFMSIALCILQLLVRRGTLGKDDAAVVGMLFLFLVPVPIAVALFVNWIRRHEDPAA